VSEFSDRVLEALGPALTARAGTLLEPLVDGLTSELGATDALLSPAGDEAWPVVFDLDTTPHPAWLGQTAGTRVPGGLSRQQQREYVQDRRAWRRGTPGAIRAAVAATLRGSRRVELLERNGSPWQLTVQVYSSEVPGGDTAPVLAAAQSQKPVGIVVDVQVLTGATYAHMTAAHGPTYADFAAAFPTYDQARDHIPEA
jgi:hypothetical protein